MNLTFQQGEQLLNDILNEKIRLKPEQHVIFAVPCPSGTVHVEVTLESAGATDAVFRDVRLRGIPDSSASGS